MFKGKNPAQKKPIQKKRFAVILNEGLGLDSVSTIVKDTHTGVLYLYHSGGFGGGLTPLLGKDGKPQIEPPKQCSSSAV
ncbi:MAG: DUF6440 family protein [Oscillospiraceae bacterium]|nr:DUF6440 family protein [Oscillospiraceae bacterium]